MFTARYDTNPKLRKGRAMAQSWGPDLSWPVNVKCVVNNVALAQVFSELLGFSLSVSFHQCSIIIFTYMLLLPEKQRAEAWERSEKQYSLGNRGALVRKVLYFHIFRLYSFKCAWQLRL